MEDIYIEDKPKSNSNLVSYILIFIILGLVIYLAYYVNTESYQCMSSPLTYGASKFVNSLNATISCSCTMPGVNQRLSFDKYGMKIDETEIFYSQLENLSTFK